MLGAIGTKIVNALNIYETLSLRDSTDYWCLLDPSAMAIALAGEAIVEELRYSRNDIILCGKY